MQARVRVEIAGLVQGVGFRPYLYRLAQESHLTGFVQNNGSGVYLELQGESKTLKNTLELIRRRAPQNSRIETLAVSEIAVEESETTFRIVQSSAASVNTQVPADCAICDNCLREFYDPQSRHYMNFFISCTDCGPRYSALKFLPYDREGTTMDEFPLCSDCNREYTSPGERRFHAQSTTCRVCGPFYSAFDCRGNRDIPFLNDRQTIEFAAGELQRGKVIALQGIGGYHLLGDPAQIAVVQRIKQGKMRDGKPLALVVQDIRHLRHLCAISDKEQEWFLSAGSPIILARLKQGNPFGEANDNLSTIGVMRPYTAALHYLLTVTGAKFLVATSANLSGRPTLIESDQAKAELNGLADCIISHNRQIYRRVDDTVSFFSDGPVIIRPGRGVAPLTFACAGGASSLRLLAMGGEQKATVALGTGHTIVMSEYLGDLHTAEYRQAYGRAVEKFLDLYQVQPSVVVHDLNPDYFSTRLGRELASRFGAKAVAVQHHEAHVLSVMMEHSCNRAIGFAFDGTGLGYDGTIWGGEGFAVLPGQDVRRVFSLEMFPLISGSKSIQEPDRLLYYFLQELDPGLNEKLFSNDDKLSAVYRSYKAMGAPLTSSMGRLFDTVAVLLGCGRKNTYEAMLPLHLESIADAREPGYYTVTINQKERVTVSPYGIINSLIQDLKQGTERSILAARFHNTIARVVTQASGIIRESTDHNTVVLAGGVFQNRLLLERTKQYLQEKKFKVLHGHLVPMNDSGISVGQAGYVHIVMNRPNV